MIILQLLLLVIVVEAATEIVVDAKITGFARWRAVASWAPAPAALRARHQGGAAGRLQAAALPPDAR